MLANDGFMNDTIERLIYSRASTHVLKIGCGVGL